MKAILEFSLPDDEVEFAKAVAAPELAYSLYEFNEWMRALLKHDGWDNKKEYVDVPTALQTVREELWKILDRNDVNLDKLVV